MEYITLADLVKRWGDLPEYLQFEIDPNKDVDKIYESIYKQNLKKLDEGRKGIRTAMADYLKNTPPEDMSYATFKKAEQDFLSLPENEDFKEYEYNREMTIYKNGGYDDTLRKLGFVPSEKGGFEPYTGNSQPKKIGDSRPKFNPETDTDPFLKALYVACKKGDDESSVEQSVDDKYNNLFETARNIANATSLNSHAVIAGDAGVGKSFTVEAAIEKGLSEWEPSENGKHKNKPTCVSISGSIGTSFSDILEFFYKNRHEKVILLDDADGFLNGTNQDIFNFMKILLNSTLKGITTPGGIRDRVNKKLRKEAENTSVEVFIDKKKLKENRLCVVVGNKCFEKKIDEVESKKLERLICESSNEQHFNPKGHINKYVNSLALKESNDIEFFDEIEKAAEEEGENNEIVIDQVPDRWIFDSNVIIITNLLLKDINEAVISRCDQVELRLSRPEYFCRANQIIDDLDVGKYSATPKVAVDWAKYEAFNIFKTVVLKSENFADFTVKVNIRFDFRLITTITNRMVSRMNQYARNKGMKLVDIMASPEQKSIMENEIIVPFTRDLLRLLKGYDAGETK